MAQFERENHLVWLFVVMLIALILCKPPFAFANNEYMTGSDIMTASDPVEVIVEDDVALNSAEYTFNGEEQTPVITVSKGGKKLSEGEDYTVSWDSNYRCYANTYTATIEGIRLYSGQVQKQYKIKPAVLSDEDSTWTLDVNRQTYAGNVELKPTVQLKCGFKYITAGDGGFDVLYSNNVNVGTATVTVVPKESGSSFVGSKTGTFQIRAAKLNSVTTEQLLTGTMDNGNITFDRLSSNPIIGKASYTGFEQSPSIPQLILFTNTTAGQVRYNLVSDDYEIGEWVNNTNVGEASVTLNGTGNFTGSLTLKWNIEPKSLADDDVVVSGLDDQVWTGSVVTPPEPVVTIGDRTLVKDTDYTLAYGENLVDVGAVEVTIEGVGNYKDAVANKFFRIAKSVESADVTVEGGQVYTGQALTPAVAVKLGDEVLVADRDYTLQYADNINAGTATVTVTGADDYIGSISKTFDIAKAGVVAPTVANGLIYTGEVQNGVLAASDAGYVISGDVSATNAGSYEVVAKLDANHVWADGSAEDVTIPWSIAPAASTIKLAAQTKTYTGKALAYSGKVTKSGSNGAVTLAYYSDAACKNEVKPANVKTAKTYYVKAIVAANGNYDAATSAAAKFTVAKAANPLKVKVASKALKVANLKKKAQSFKPTIIKKAGKGTLTFAKGKVSKKSANFKVDKKTGKITVKKGTPKGVYTIQVKVTAKGDANYKASGTKVAKVTVDVK
jgi:hypothetical protein